MDITITGRHMTVSEEVKNYANDKLGKLERYMDRIEYIEAVLEDKDGVAKVELKVGLPKRDPLVVTESEQQSLLAAIDVLHDKAERQLTKIKEKQKGKKHNVVPK